MAGPCAEVEASCRVGKNEQLLEAAGTDGKRPAGAEQALEAKARGGAAAVTAGMLAKMEKVHDLCERASSSGTVAGVQPLEGAVARVVSNIEGLEAGLRRVAGWIGRLASPCKRRRLGAAWEQGELGPPTGAASGAGRAPLAPPPGWLLPDTAARGAAVFLPAAGVARLLAADAGCGKAIALPGFLPQLVRTRGFQGVRSLAQLHMAEETAKLDTVLAFGFMSTDLTKASRVALRKYAALLVRHPTAKARIEAHAQPGAPPDLAKKLSLQRAGAAIAELAQGGVARDRLSGEAFSNLRPMSGAADSGANRRVEIYVSFDGAQFPAEHVPYDERYSHWSAALMRPFADEDDEAELMRVSELAQHDPDPAGLVLWGPAASSSDSQAGDANADGEGDSDDSSSTSSGPVASAALPSPSELAPLLAPLAQ